MTDDVATRFQMPAACRDPLTTLQPYHCLIRCRDRYAVLRVMLSAELREICDTNAAMREPT